MPIINVPDPIGAASEAIGSFAAAKRQRELDDAAQTFAQKQAAQQQSNADREYGLQQQDLAERTTSDQAAAAAAALKAKTDAQKEADDALHLARQDAIEAARETEKRTQDARQFTETMRRIDLTYKLGQQRIKGATEVADIRAAAEEASANIRAQATVQAANIHAGATIDAARIHEAGADKRAADRNNISRQQFTMRDATTRRGQDIRVDGINAQDQRAVAGAVLRLSLQKGAPKEPTADQDPLFPQALQQFYKDSPKQRAAFLASPKVPQATRDYLRALVPTLTAEPPELSAPDALLGSGGDDLLGAGDEDDDTP